MDDQELSTHRLTWCCLNLFRIESYSDHLPQPSFNPCPKPVQNRMISTAKQFIDLSGRMGTVKDPAGEESCFVDRDYIYIYTYTVHMILTSWYKMVQHDTVEIICALETQLGAWYAPWAMKEEMLRSLCLAAQETSRHTCQIFFLFSQMRVQCGLKNLGVSVSQVDENICQDTECHFQASVTHSEKKLNVLVDLLTRSF